MLRPAVQDSPIALILHFAVLFQVTNAFLALSLPLLQCTLRTSYYYYRMISNFSFVLSHFAKSLITEKFFASSFPFPRKRASARRKSCDQLAKRKSIYSK